MSTSSSVTPFGEAVQSLPGWRPALAEQLDDGAELFASVVLIELGVDVGGIVAQRGARAGGGNGIHGQTEIFVHQRGREAGLEALVGR
jgi:hypothetical protein